MQYLRGRKKKESVNVTKKQQPEAEERQGECDITNVKVRDSYKKESVRNGLAVAERSSGVRTLETSTRFSYKEIVGVVWNSGGRS